jgi:hypothetical protein
MIAISQKPPAAKLGYFKKRAAAVKLYGMSITCGRLADLKIRVLRLQN